MQLFRIFLLLHACFSLPGTSPHRHQEEATLRTRQISNMPPYVPPPGIRVSLQHRNSTGIPLYYCPCEAPHFLEEGVLVVLMHHFYSEVPKLGLFICHVPDGHVHTVAVWHVSLLLIPLGEHYTKNFFF